MKQNLYKVMDVVDIFKRLTTKHFNNFSLSYKIAKAYKELESHKDFYIAEERKLVNDYAMKDENGQIIITNNNQIKFSTPEDAIKFNEGIVKLKSTEVEVFDPIELTIDDFRKNEMDLTPIDILALEDFIIFKEEVDC